MRIVNTRFLKHHKSEVAGKTYSQALIQDKIGMQGSRSKESGRQTVRPLWKTVFRVETEREIRIELRPTE